MMKMDDHAHRPIPTPSVEDIALAVILDISQHFHFNQDAWWYNLFHRLAMLPAVKFARVMRQSDLKVATHSLWEAARELLPRFTQGWEVMGGKHLPQEGPLLIASNHPGAVDSIAALAVVERQDVHLLAYERPTLNALPNTSEHILYLDEYNPARLDIMRSLIQFLKYGEAVLMFPRGTVEPDPALYHGALDSLKHWSQSLGLFLSRVPETVFQLILTQNVLAPKAWNHPVAKLGKSDRQRHQIGMILQTIMQQLFGKWKIHLRMTLPDPVHADQLAANDDPGSINLAVKDYIGGEMEKAFKKL
jgi:hypothetical protein